VQDYADK
nr:NAD(+)-dependent glutamate dehydrogenase, GDH [Clostridium symbiosum, Peptide Partial, 7 aa] [[Clostridium] symbiosum]